jgi:hypothetical protein
MAMRRRLPVVFLGLSLLGGAAFAQTVPVPAGEPPAKPEAVPEAKPDIGVDSGELTAMGAIRAGDQYRFVPEYTGGLTGPIRGQIKDQPPPDPYYEDSRWFTVTQSDLERYGERMPDGMRELLRRYKSFEIPLYPSRRSASAPRAVLEGAVANLTRASTGNNGLSVAGVENGVPFPIPRTGMEAMWNHLLRWRGGPSTRTNGFVIPDAYGNLKIERYREDWLPAYVLGMEASAALYYRRALLDGPAEERTVLAIQDALDPVRRPRRAFYLAPKAQRPVLAPDFVYGTPDPATKGVRTADMLDMFSGALDRYLFTLIGRRTMYMPYNAYRLVQPRVEPKDFLWAEHPNPGYLRYEMHRVWVVKAELKKGYRHPVAERTYYLDEDSWQILAADHFDAKHALVRYAEAHCIAYGEPRVFGPAVEFTYDFAERRYAVNGLANREPPPNLKAKLVPADFESDALIPRPRR